MNQTKTEGFVSVEESPQEITLKRKWRGSWWYVIPLILGGVLIGLWLPKFDDVIKNDNPFVAYGFIPISLLLTYIGLCGVFNVITIRINYEAFELKQGIFPLPLSGVKFAMKDFDRVVLEKTQSRTGRRMYSTQKGFHDEKSHDGYDLIVYLQNNRKKDILSFGIGAVGADFLRDKISQFAPKY
jgi:hypothetical protein